MFMARQCEAAERATNVAGRRQVDDTISLGWAPEDATVQRVGVVSDCISFGSSCITWFTHAEGIA